ncbi:MAG TPA: ABC transporter ATP-binding protein [Polyangiaceae bacterium]|nr:ABC transporter ATP-binding protein [Polyangiaceae bacterium]
MNRQPRSSRQRYQDFVLGQRRARNTWQRTIERAKQTGILSLRLHQRKRALSWLKPSVRDLSVVVAWSLLGIGLDLAWPLASAALIDRVVLNSSIERAQKAYYLLVGALGLTGVFLLNAALTWIRTVRTQLVTSKLQAGLRQRVYHHVLRLGLADIHALRSGGLLSRLSVDVEHTAQLVQLALLGPLFALVRLVLTIGVLFSLDYRIAAIVTLTVPPLLLLQLSWSRKMRGIWRSIAQDRSEIDARVNEAIGGIRVVRGFGRERREELEHAIGLHTLIRKQVLAARTRRASTVVWELIVPMTQVVIVCYGGYLVVVGQTTLGTVIAFQVFLSRLLEPILALIHAISDTQRGLAAMDRLFELLSMPTEGRSDPKAVDVPASIEQLQFADVSFAYRPDLPIIEHFNLTVPGNSVVALVGPSGAGKSTLTDLLARFYDPTSGAILLNGIDLRRYKLESYRGCLGVVSQEVFLFDGTVRENIAYGRLDAPDVAIEAAAQAAHAHEFISKLPEGYDTVIGERGVKLSGGQRQRLSIARALLADPEILILDEATSNLDTESERLIQGALSNLVARRTTFIIAHRLSTIIHADLIVVLESGRIVEAGSHRELMQRSGVYARMVERQQKHSNWAGNIADWTDS